MRIFILRSVKASNGRFRLSGSRRRHRPCDQGYTPLYHVPGRSERNDASTHPALTASKKKKKKKKSKQTMNLTISSVNKSSMSAARRVLHPAPCTLHPVPSNVAGEQVSLHRNTVTSARALVVQLLGQRSWCLVQQVQAQPLPAPGARFRGAGGTNALVRRENEHHIDLFSLYVIVYKVTSVLCAKFSWGALEHTLALSTQLSMQVCRQQAMSFPSIFVLYFVVLLCPAVVLLSAEN